VTVRSDILPPRYTNVEHIARGGMGDVFRATDTTLGRTVAVKVLSERYADDADIKRRFKNEALAAARVSGAPSTVTIFDVGENDGQPFIVMEFFEGGSLEQRLRAGRPDPADVLRWLEQAAAALDAGHAAGVVHRDVKPGNLLLDGREDVHVADFGVASAVGLDSLTMTGTVLGTAGYLSPEQAQGHRATPASDRYGLAVVAWELLTGKRPFESESPTAEATAHVNAPIPAISVEGFPPELDPVFELALAKDPNARYASAADFVAALREALRQAAGTTDQFAAVREEQYVAAPAPGAAPRRVGWLIALLAALALIGGGLGLAAVLGGDEEPRTRTVVEERKMTVTEEGQLTTVVRTVTTTRQATTATTTGTTATTAPTAPGAVSASEAARLNDQAFALMNAGRYEEALPMLERAIGPLRGSGSLTEAYTSYNLAETRLRLGRCNDVIALLDRSQSIQGERSEITSARQRAREQCE
jgi:predicted Ser/Thr protein kinase/tetratricopeptide (TPR) repeat protein